MRFSADKRGEILRRMRDETHDLLVIGGGITGAGIALDARTRGLATALVEMQDFAAGTSSRSTKLVHGGLRYLKNFEVKMVAEVGRERAVVYENGPHITTPEWMLLPIYEGGTFGKWTTSLGLYVYDRLAGVRKSERRVMLTAEETLRREPLLKRDGLKGGGYYVEYRTDDARLTIEVLKRAVQEGALAVNYAKAERLLYEDGKVVGAEVVDRLTGERYPIRARQIVNAAGPWADTVREMDRSKEGKTLHLTKGVHLVFDQGRFPLRQAIYFDTPDGRMVFAIPRDGKTYVGTTDTNYDGDLENPVCTEEDLAYLLNAANGVFPGLKLVAQDVESSWAGLRPLIHQEGKDPSEISRKDEIFVSPSGLLSIAGGKLTGYRKMAEDVVGMVVRQLQAAGDGRNFGPSRTKTMKLSGGEVGGSAHFPQFVQEKKEEGAALGLAPEAAERLARRYGSNADQVYRLAAERREEADRYGLPPETLGELEYAISCEMAAKPVDYLIRRTGALFFDIGWARRRKDAVVAYMADRLGWTEEQKLSHDREIEQQLAQALPLQKS